MSKKITFSTSLLNQIDWSITPSTDSFEGIDSCPFGGQTRNYTTIVFGANASSHDESGMTFGFVENVSEAEIIFNSNLNSNLFNNHDEKHVKDFIDSYPELNAFFKEKIPVYAGWSGMGLNQSSEDYISMLKDIKGHHKIQESTEMQEVVTSLEGEIKLNGAQFIKIIIVGIFIWLFALPHETLDNEIVKPGMPKDASSGLILSDVNEISSGQTGSVLYSSFTASTNFNKN